MKVQVFRMPISKMKEWFELKLEIPVQKLNTDTSNCIIKSGEKRLLTINFRKPFFVKIVNFIP